MSKKITQMSKTNRLDNRGGKREGAEFRENELQRSATTRCCGKVSQNFELRNNKNKYKPNIELCKTDVISSFFMYKVVSECNNNEVWASGFYSKEKAQKRIYEGYYHKFMYDDDKNKKLIIIEYGKN